MFTLPSSGQCLVVVANMAGQALRVSSAVTGGTEFDTRPPGKFPVPGQEPGTRETDMNGWVWLGIIIGLAVVALAVGIPYVITHKGMRSPRDVSDSRTYLQAKRRRRWQKSATSAQSGPATSPQGISGSLPADDGPQA